MKEKIIISGHGGQGVVVAGSLLANTAIAENLHVTGMVSYGGEMRGGTANASLVISDKPIGSPVIDRATAAILLNQPSLDKFEPLLSPGGLLLVNSSLTVRGPRRTDLTLLPLDATRLAEELGNPRAANMILIGAFIRKTGLLSLERALKNIEVVFPHHEHWEINRQALRRGAELALPLDPFS